MTTEESKKEMAEVRALVAKVLESLSIKMLTKPIDIQYQGDTNNFFVEVDYNKARLNFQFDRRSEIFYAIRFKAWNNKLIK